MTSERTWTVGLKNGRAGFDIFFDNSHGMLLYLHFYLFSFCRALHLAYVTFLRTLTEIYMNGY